MKKVTILHNPKCSKSRQTLALLQEQGLDPVVIEYLKSPLSESEIRAIFKQLNSDDITDMMRRKDDAFKALSQRLPSPSEDDYIKAMVSEPKLIERPIVICNEQARIGRPPESVLEII